MHGYDEEAETCRHRADGARETIDAAAPAGQRVRPADHRRRGRVPLRVGQDRARVIGRVDLERAGRNRAGGLAACTRFPGFDSFCGIGIRIEHLTRGFALSHDLCVSHSNAMDSGLIVYQDSQMLGNSLVV